MNSGDRGERLSVPVADLRRRTDPGAFAFATTAELEPITSLIGQDRALNAIRFGVGIDQPDFNLFVLGPPGSGKTTAVRSYLKAKARSAATPADWVYVHNFETPHKPKAIKLPPGRAPEFRDAMVRVIDELRTAIPALFESDDYQTRRRVIDDEMRARQEEAFEALNAKAEAESLTILRTQMGFAVAPVREGAVIKPEIFAKLPEDERHVIQEKIETIQGEMAKLLEAVPGWQKEHRERLRDLNEELAEIAVHDALSDPTRDFTDIEAIGAYFSAVERDLIHNVGLFLTDGADGKEMVTVQIDTVRDARFRPYMVNVLVTQEERGAPIVQELNPTLGNLVGRIERLAQMGALITDFLLIKPGALHRANGGYLLLDARKVLLAPMAWEALKRALRGSEITFESPGDQISLVSTVSLEPERVPLGLKVVLFGDRLLYYQLAELDPDFSRLFKVAADFDDTIDREDHNIRAYARLVASITERHGLRPVDAEGVARMIDQGARFAADSEKLTLKIDAMADILREADYWAGEAGHAAISERDVSRAVAEQIHRLDRVREKTQEGISRNIILIDTESRQVGQVNGLSVLGIGVFAFGRPSRITARTRMGAGRLVDIEREVTLGGPLHSKGVMILRGFLEGRYAHEVPLSLSASLVFEQSYGGVDGDSASSAELYAVLSSLSDIGLDQGLAVTGSVNQRGEVQAIGGANEKIEGFFDVCKARGLSGKQGVIIPRANIVHLMLREDVVEAVAAGQFTIYAVSTIDEGLEILTGVKAGARDGRGEFPVGSINRLVEDRLIAFAEARARFHAGGPIEDATS